MLVSKVQLAPPTEMNSGKHNGRANFEIGYSRKVLFLHFLWYLKWFYESHEVRLPQTNVHTGLCQASETELFAKIFIDLKLLAIFGKRFPC